MREESIQRLSLCVCVCVFKLFRFKNRDIKMQDWLTCLGQLICGDQYCGLQKESVKKGMLEVKLVRDQLSINQSARESDFYKYNQIGGRYEKHVVSSL